MDFHINLSKTKTCIFLMGTVLLILRELNAAETELYKTSLVGTSLPLLQMGEEPANRIQQATFTPPKGWRFADPQKLPPNVKVMVVGESQLSFPPSINLGTEFYRGTLKEYLQIVKAINDAKGAEWRDLGMIRTGAGDASLSQLDIKTEWGDVRMMHLITIKDHTVYIATAAALREEFPKFYSDFFTSMRSLCWSTP